MRTPTWIIFTLIAFAGFIFITILLSLLLPPVGGVRRYPYVVTVPRTTPLPTTTSTVTTTITTTVATTTIAPNTTTPIPLTTVQIECPADVNVTIGSSLLPSVTGFATATAGNGAGCGTPVVYRSDESDGFIDADTSMLKKRQTMSDVEQQQQQHHGRDVEQQQQLEERSTTEEERLANLDEERSATRMRNGIAGSSWLMSLGQSPTWIPLEDKKRSKKRSPSFSTTNIQVDAGGFDHTTTAIATCNSAASATEVLNAVSYCDRNEPATIYITDTTLNTVVGSFSPSASFGSGHCTFNATACGGTISWDEEAQRWIMLESSFTHPSTLCLYLSSTADAMDTW